MDTVDSFAEAEVEFLKRSNINGELDSQYIQQLDWSEDVKFKANDGDTKSFELDELLQEGSDFGLKWLFRQQYDEETSTNSQEWEEYFSQALSWLFELFQDPFGEDGIKQDDLVEVITFKKKNKLFEAFKQDNLYTPKRKRSPEEEVTKKMRRMTIAEDASPALRKSHYLRRTSSVSLIERRGNKKKDVREKEKIESNSSRLIQTRLTHIWRKKKAQDQEDKNDSQ